MSETMLKTTGLASHYGQARALHGVDVEVLRDEVVAVLGHNGAGKSTLLGSIARTHRRIDGVVELAGKDISRDGAAAVARAGLSFVREGAPVFRHLTVEENLRLGARLARRRGVDPAPFDEVWSWFPILEEKRRSEAALLSGGQRQMLAISVAVVSRPRVLLLDEPSAGLAPTMAESVFVAIRQMCASGMAVLLAEQDLHWVKGFASRAYLLETGRVVNERVFETTSAPVAATESA